MKLKTKFLVMTQFLSFGVVASAYAEIETKLTAFDAAANDRYGWAVAIDGEYAIVGSKFDDDGASNAGSAYIYVSDGNIWSEEAKLSASDGGASDEFGFSVAISGNYAIVGAPGDDDFGSNSGSAYIFFNNGSSWTQQAKLTASVGVANDEFGTSVSIEGDYAIVGASFDDAGTMDSGGAYIFHRSGSTWTEQAILSASDAATNDQFGQSVSIDGDYAIIGALADDFGTGSAYIFNRSGSSWTQQAKLIASDAAASDLFGKSVSISGEYAIVGARLDDDNGGASGSAYIFNRSGTSWSEQTKLTASDAAANDEFGFSVAIDGDRAVVGAHTNDDDGTNSGSAYVFSRSGTSWSEEAKITANDASANDQFGYSVSVSGFNAIVGGFRNDDDGTDSGSAYVFTGTDIGLPVELTSFYAEIVPQGVNIKWETGTETDNKGFIIRRSDSDNGDFKIVASYVYDEELRGQINSAFSTHYVWTDFDVKSGNEYFYYISDIDLEGKETHHKDRMISILVETELTNNTNFVKDFVLKQNFPNPFNPETTISFELKKDSKVKLQIFNENGKFVKELYNDFKTTGSHKIVWNGKDSFGNQVSSGIYFYKINAGGTLSQTKKMILIK